MIVSGTGWSVYETDRLSTFSFTFKLWSLEEWVLYRVQKGQHGPKILWGQNERRLVWDVEV